MAWTLRELLVAAGVNADVSGDTTVSGLAYDSRTVSAGDLFFCIPGHVADGHDHAAVAVAAGASALVVERPVEVDAPQARVASVRAVLGLVADAFYVRPSAEIPIAAVTGTNGKTTVTYLLESIARAAGREPGVIGTVSRRYAGREEPAPRNTPEAIDVQHLLAAMREAGVDFVAMEATSDGLVQGRMDGTRVACAAFTNLTQDHLNTHGTMEAYFQAKALLFDERFTRRAVINVDDGYGKQLYDRVRGKLDVVTYGAAADIVLDDIQLSADGSRAVVSTPIGSLDVRTSLVGRYNVENCMCATGVALQCGFDLDAIARGIETLERVPGRLDNVDCGQDFLALVDYAHTPDALEHALRAARELAVRKVIVVFGCGGDRDRAKRPLMGEAATRLADLTFVTSDNPRTEAPEAIIADITAGAARGGGTYEAVIDRRDAIARALSEARTGDVVVVAGKGHEQGQQFADRTIPFDDRAVIRDLLEGARCPT